MSRQYNPAITAYKRMDLDGFNELDKSTEQEKSSSGGGLLSRSSMPSKNSKELDYSNPAVRVAKQMQVIRKYRDEINGTK
jgi:hypothetical protein|tara:strand:+ start:701 stop:940 length:240 start_codon:yes stop_codon:yes gene_type:complete